MAPRCQAGELAPALRVGLWSEERVVSLRNGIGPVFVSGVVPGITVAPGSLRRGRSSSALGCRTTLGAPMSVGIVASRLQGRVVGGARAMSFDLSAMIEARSAEREALYERHVNPQMARVLRAIGFDRRWVQGRGAILVDSQGREYLDTLSGWGVFSLGRNHPTIARAITDLVALRAANLVKMDAPLLAGVLAEALAQRAPAGLSTVHFTNSGTESAEAALKFARCATRRRRVVFCDNGYHGLTYGSLSAMGSDYFREGFGPVLADFTAVPFGDLGSLERELARGDVALFITEPIQGHGVIMPPAGYLREANAL